jgi:hypothetical protein
MGTAFSRNVRFGHFARLTATTFAHIQREYGW